jgi:hypothetical protein
LFLLRAARLGRLAHDFAYADGLPAEHGALIVWAMRSTLEDCRRLEVYAEAVVLSLGKEAQGR